MQKFLHDMAESTTLKGYLGGAQDRVKSQSSPVHPFVFI